jgi:hypothetical protein
LPFYSGFLAEIEAFMSAEESFQRVWRQLVQSLADERSHLLIIGQPSKTRRCVQYCRASLEDNDLDDSKQRRIYYAENLELWPLPDLQWLIKLADTELFLIVATTSDPDFVRQVLAGSLATRFFAMVDL